MLFIIGFVVTLYESASLLLPLRISWLWRIFWAAVILAVSCRNSIFSRLGGGMFFAPELPLWLLLIGAWLYSAFFLAFVFSVAKDILWLCWRILSHGGAFPAAAASAVVIAASLLLSLYGTWAAMKVPDVRYENAVIKDLPRGLEGFKIALLADMHISAMNTEPLISKIVDKTNKVGADVILLNGDMVDGTVANRADGVQPLARLKARYGVYGTTGNHEYYSGYGEWAKKFKELGITMLDNSHDVIESNGAKLIIAGIVDQNSLVYGYDGPNISEALRGAPDAPVVLMAHRPEDAADNSAAGVDIQLSGHTHGGMAIGFDRFIARFNGGYVRGWYDVDGMKLYVSPGTLLWNGFALRLGVPSEITVLTLLSDSETIAKQ